jgi:hypothetical protein
MTFPSGFFCCHSAVNFWVIAVDAEAGEGWSQLQAMWA